MAKEKAIRVRLMAYDHKILDLSVEKILDVAKKTGAGVKGFYPFAADWQEQSAGRTIAPGLGIYFLHPNEKNWPLSTIKRQLHYLRNEGLSGQAYFRSKFLTDNTKGIYDYLRDDFYAFPALPPACTWSGNSSPTAPQNLRLKETAAGHAELVWDVAENNGESEKLRYNVYASSEWPVDISLAENLVATLLPEPRFSFDPVYTALSNLYLAVTTIDRYGNESAATQLFSEPSASILPFRLPLDSSGRVVDLISCPASHTFSTISAEKVRK